MTTTENVRNELKTLEDPTYREFHSSLIPGADNILGVRIPQLRTMAKEIAKKEDWRTFVEATGNGDRTCQDGTGRTNQIHSPLRPANQ